MDRDKIRSRLEAEIDLLADIEHERWSHWQQYMHSNGERLEDGTLVLPAHLVKQWEQQITTTYARLSSKEKESDREQVRKYLPTIVEILTTN